MQKDLTEKTLESYNDVFSDILNVLLFNGQQIVREDDLSDAATISQYKIDNQIHEQERDVTKFWKNGTIRICLFGFENQTQIDYDMPLRVINYDGIGYRSQLQKKGSQKSNNRYPVVTLVLYFGENHWNKRTLLECLEIPQDLKDYVSDYRINVFEIAWLKDEQIKFFKSDFKIVADFFVQKRKHKDYIPTKDTIKHVDEVLKLMAALTGDRNYERIQQEFHSENPPGGTNMCEVLKKWHDSGFEKGMTAGVQKGIKKGERKKVIEFSQKLLEMKILTLAQISEATGITVDELKEMEKNLD